MPRSGRTTRSPPDALCERLYADPTDPEARAELATYDPRIAEVLAAKAAGKRATTVQLARLVAGSPGSLSFRWDDPLVSAIRVHPEGYVPGLFAGLPLAARFPTRWEAVTRAPVPEAVVAELPRSVRHLEANVAGPVDRVLARCPHLLEADVGKPTPARCGTSA